jgi:fermentation-respiration switch protein FrsA (DUF1100 family)
VGVLVVLLLLENYLVYPATTAAQHWMDPPPNVEIQDVELVSASGVKLHGWWLPHPTSDRTLYILHGNAGNLSHRGATMVGLRDILDTAVFIIDYPGYGKSAGSPSEAGCCEAATAGYDWLTQTQNRDPKRLVLYGESLGGGVAVDLASRKPNGALVLLKTFTSLPDVAQGRFPWLPVRYLMRNKLPSIDRIGEVKSPIFIAHGDVDSVIPYELGERLFAAAPEPKTFVRLPGQDHNDKLDAAFFVPLKQFLDTNLPVAEPSRMP